MIALRIIAVILMLLGALSIAGAFTCREEGGAMDVDLFTCDGFVQIFVGIGLVIAAAGGILGWASFRLGRGP